MKALRVGALGRVHAARVGCNDRRRGEHHDPNLALEADPVTMQGKRFDNGGKEWKVDNVKKVVAGYLGAGQQADGADARRPVAEAETLHVARTDQVR